MCVKDQGLIFTEKQLPGIEEGIEGGSEKMLSGLTIQKFEMFFPIKFLHQNVGYTVFSSGINGILT